jgi:hypothetical protein
VRGTVLALLAIEREGVRSTRYVVRDDRGRAGTWVRRRFTEAMTGELDGVPYEFVRSGRRHFALHQSGDPIAAAQRSEAVG